MEHILLIIVNTPKNGSTEQENVIKNLVINASTEILGDRAKEAKVGPAGLKLEYHDLKDAYRQHFEKLVNLRKRFDPMRRFKALVNH